MYEVIWGEVRKNKQVETLREALQLAKEKIGENVCFLPYVVDEGGCIIAVVTDDANDLTIHRLIAQNQIEREDRKVWEEFQEWVSPGFGR